MVGKMGIFRTLWLAKAFRGPLGISPLKFLKLCILLGALIHAG